MRRTDEARRKIIGVACAIHAEPERYRQEEFASIRNADLPESEGRLTWYPGDDVFCKTAFCIAGWNHALHHATEESLMESHYVGGEWIGVWWSRNHAHLVEELCTDFELTEREAAILCSEGWKPRDATVLQALVGIAYGASVDDVTDRDVLTDW